MTERISARRLYADVEQTRLLRFEPEGVKRPGDKRTDSVVNQDAVDISAAAVLMQRAKEAVEAAPEVRKDVVTRLRQEIASGTYQVDTQELGRRILDVLV
ncbi:MAG: flagellar biosynthesis anti-sigma factor FlgM [Anaerolineae bacterium]